MQKRQQIVFLKKYTCKQKAKMQKNGKRCKNINYIIQYKIHTPLVTIGLVAAIAILCFSLSSSVLQLFRTRVKAAHDECRYSAVQFEEKTVFGRKECNFDPWFRNAVSIAVSMTVGHTAFTRIFAVLNLCIHVHTVWHTDTLNANEFFSGN